MNDPIACGVRVAVEIDARTDVIRYHLDDGTYRVRVGVRDVKDSMFVGQAHDCGFRVAHNESIPTIF